MYLVCIWRMGITCIGPKTVKMISRKKIGSEWIFIIVKFFTGVSVTKPLDELLG